MLIVRGVNLFPTAVREVVAGFAPAVSGVIAIRPRRRGVRQAPPLPVVVELAEGQAARPELAEAIRGRLRERAGGGRRGRAGALGEPAAQRLQVEARRLVPGGN